MLSALLGTMLIFITGIAVPLGWPLKPELMNYAHMQAFAHNWIGKAFLLAVIAFFAWHAVHCLLCTVHDFGIHKGPLVKTLFYGFAMLLTVTTAVHLLMI
jgi:fumarate reductase subunit D